MTSTKFKFFVFFAILWLYIGYLSDFPGVPRDWVALVTPGMNKPSAPSPGSVAEREAEKQQQAFARAATEAETLEKKEAQRRRAEEIDQRNQEILEQFSGVYVSTINGRRTILWVHECGGCGRRDWSSNWAKFEVFIDPVKGAEPTLAHSDPSAAGDGFTQFDFCAGDMYKLDHVKKNPGRSTGCDPIPLFSGVSIEPWTEGQSLRFSMLGMNQAQTIIWRRVEEDSSERLGLERRTGLELFKAIIARGSLPIGKPMESHRVAWQPMVHPATGVRWLKFTGAPTPQALSMLNREMQRRFEMRVTGALYQMARGETSAATAGVSFINAKWLVLQSSGSGLAEGTRNMFEIHDTFDIQTGEHLPFSQVFHYATLKRLNNTIAIDDSGAADEGILSAALREMGPRAGARCMQRWLDAHNCSTTQACAYRGDTPGDMQLYPGDQGLAVEFTHWRVEGYARETQRSLPDKLSGDAWKSCVTDTVVVPWKAAKLALRKNVKLELP